MVHEDLNWLDIVDRYVNALHEDSLNALQAKSESQQALVLQDHGTELISQRFQNMQRQRIENTREPVSQEKWEVLEQEEDQVLILIPVTGKVKANSRQAPFVSLQIRLDKIEGNWTISEVLMPCIACNFSTRPTTPGVCKICKGSGSHFSKFDQDCRFCTGSGLCPKCCSSKTPGWQHKGL